MLTLLLLVLALVSSLTSSSSSGSVSGSWLCSRCLLASSSSLSFSSLISLAITSSVGLTLLSTGLTLELSRRTPQDRFTSAAGTLSKFSRSCEGGEVWQSDK